MNLFFFFFKIPTNTTIFIHPRHLLLHHLPYPHPNPQSSPKCGHCRFFNIFIQNPYLLTWRIIKKKKLFVLKQIWIYFYFFIFKIPTNTTIFIHPRHLLHHLPYPHPNPQSSPKCGHCRFFNIFIQNPYLLTWRIIFFFNYLF